MGTLSYDQWSVFKNYYANNYRQPPSVLNPKGIIRNAYVPQNMHDTLDLTVGTHYRLNPQWLLRGSLKYEDTPTITAYRDVNNPDGPKLGINLGARYQMCKKLAMDFIYAHVFVKTVGIHSYNSVSHSVLSGRANTSVDLAGAQIVWDI